MFYDSKAQIGADAEQNLMLGAHISHRNRRINGQRLAQDCGDRQQQDFKNDVIACRAKFVKRGNNFAEKSLNSHNGLFIDRHYKNGYCRHENA